MDLGSFSVSLAVEDLGASRAFYETLGFKVIGGEASQENSVTGYPFAAGKLGDRLPIRRGKTR